MSGMSDGIQDFFLADVRLIYHFISHKSGTDPVNSLLIIHEINYPGTKALSYSHVI